MHLTSLTPNRRTFALLALACLAPTGASAAITWTWNLDGIQGYFVTSGELIDGVATAGTYTVTDFGITNNGGYEIPVGSIIGGQWNHGTQGDTGFKWNGSQPTEFFRGVYTNGSNYFTTTGEPRYRMLAFPGSFSFSRITNQGESLVTYSSSISMTAVPEPHAISCAAVTALALLTSRRRRKA